MNFISSLLGRTVASPRPLSQSKLEVIPHPDVAVVTACLQGDASAWSHLIDKYGHLVYSIALKFTSSRDEAETVFENVFVTVLQTLPQLRQEQSLAPYLSTITQREAQRLGKQPRTRVEFIGNFEGPSDHPVQQVHSQWLGEQVYLALWQLDPFAREFLLACLTDSAPTSQELADRFELPVVSISPTLARCLKRLESILTGMGISDLAQNGTGDQK